MLKVSFVLARPVLQIFRAAEVEWVNDIQEKEGLCSPVFQLEDPPNIVSFLVLVLTGVYKTKFAK